MGRRGDWRYDYRVRVSPRMWDVTPTRVCFFYLAVCVNKGHVGRVVQALEDARQRPRYQHFSGVLQPTGWGAQ
eukprot:680524-Prorocentrum_minimum.AAC.3